ncbi:MAG: 30S ribosomal protein S9 [Gemmatimonadota bacterium]
MDSTVTEQVQTVGRRKRAVARALVRPGRGNLTINGRSPDEYFPVARRRARVSAPLKAAGVEGLYDIVIRVRGGGPSGQADAVRLSIARALVRFDEDRRSTLRSHGLLTRDPRIVERKKPGRPKARKRFQFSKR